MIWMIFSPLVAFLLAGRLPLMFLLVTANLL